MHARKLCHTISVFILVNAFACFKEFYSIFFSGLILRVGVEPLGVIFGGHKIADDET